jgi:hypothetical protein
VGAVLGHMFPVWPRFKGGKGVATTLGVMRGLSWPVGAITSAAWLGLAALFRYSSVAALLSVVIGAAAAWLMLDWRVALAITLLVPLVWVRARLRCQKRRYDGASCGNFGHLSIAPAERINPASAIQRVHLSCGRCVPSWARCQAGPAALVGHLARQG